MEINPEELVQMIETDDSDVDEKDVIETVDSYLYTTIEILTEAVVKRLQNKPGSLSNRLGKSILHQLQSIRDNDLVSPDSKVHLEQIQKLLQ